MNKEIIKKNFFLYSLSLDNILFFSASILPIALMAGAFFSNLFATVVSIIFLLISINKKIISYYKNIFILIFFSFCIFLVISSVASDFKLFSLKSSLIYFRHGIFAIAIAYCLINYKNFKVYFFYSLLFSYILIIVTGYYEFIYNENIFGVKSDLYRLSMITNEKWIVGGYISRTLPIALVLFLVIGKDKLINKYLLFLFLLLFILSFLLVILSGERSPMVVIIITMIICLFIFNKFKKIRLFFLFSSIILSVLVVNYNEDLKTRIIKHTYSQLGFYSGQLNLFSPVHEEYYSESFAMFKQSPIIGKGPNTFRKYCDHVDYNIGDYCSTHPHNYYFQLLGETGLIGFLYLFSSFIFISWIIFKQTMFKLKIFSEGITNNLLILYTSMFSLLWPIIPSYNFFNSWNSITLYLIAGFLLADYFSNENN